MIFFALPLAAVGIIAGLILIQKFGDHFMAEHSPDDLKQDERRATH